MEENKAEANLHRRGIFFMIFLMIYGFLFSIAMAVIFSVLEMYIPIDRRAVVTSPWFIIFSQVMALIVPLGIWLAVTRDKLATHLPKTELGAKNVILIVGISLMLVPIANVISGLTMFFFPNEIGGIMFEAAESHSLIVLLLAIAVTPAICEEVVFRGYIQSVYRGKTLIVMAVANGFFFAAIHSSPQQFFYAFAAGIIFAYMVYATQSVRAGVIAHFVMNAVSVILIWFAIQMQEFLPEEYYTPELPEGTAIFTALAFWGFLAVFSAIAAVYLFKEFAAHNKERISEIKISNEELSKTSRKNLAIDVLLILVIVFLYVLFTFA